MPTGSANDAARGRPCMLAIAQHHYAVDEHITHSARVLARVLISGFASDAIGIEHGDIREVAHFQQAPIAQMMDLGRQIREAMYRLWQRNDLLLTHEIAHHSRETAVRPRVGKASGKLTLGSRVGIRPETEPGQPHLLADVVFRDEMIRRKYRASVFSKQIEHRLLRRAMAFYCDGGDRATCVSGELRILEAQRGYAVRTTQT